MIKRLPLLAMGAVIAVIAWDGFSRYYPANEDQSAAIESSRPYGRYQEPVDFKIPGEQLVQYRKLSPGFQDQIWSLSQASYEPNGKWTLWVLTNYWSDYSGLNKKYVSALASKRYNMLSEYLLDIRHFRLISKLDFEMNVIAYGMVGQFHMTPPNNPRAGSLAFGSSATDCKMAFLGCVDNFYFSPVPIPPAEVDSDWMNYLNHYVKPYAGHHDDPKAWEATKRRVLAEQKGTGLIGSPDLVFLVDPNGKAVFGWIGLYGLKPATPYMVSQALIEALDANPHDPAIAKGLDAVRESKNTPIAYGHHGLPYVDWNLGRLENSVSRVFGAFLGGANR